MKRISLLILFVALAFVGNAQKFGYLNTQELLLGLPEVKAADTELETYQKQLLTIGQGKMAEFETAYKQYMEDSQKGILSQVQAQQKEAELTTKQQELQKYEAEVQEKLVAKRETLYKPILDRVKAVIEAYGKENSYTMIFDTSGGTLLHALDSDNLLEVIKTKLGTK